jgi:hypothetical protein
LAFNMQTAATLSHFFNLSPVVFGYQRYAAATNQPVGAWFQNSVSGAFGTAASLTRETNGGAMWLRSS